MDDLEVRCPTASHEGGSCSAAAWRQFTTGVFSARTTDTTSRRPSRLASASIGTVQRGVSAWVDMALAYDFDAVARHRAAGQPCQGFTRRPDPGDDGIRRHVQQRQQCERALVQVRMRDPQSRLVDHHVAVQQHVEVQQARPPAVAAIGGADPAEGTFDCKQFLKQVRRRQRGFQRGCGIDEVGLVALAPGRGAIEPRCAQQAGEGETERKFAAALGVLGTINLPIIHFSVQKWGGVHPSVIGRGGGGLRHPDMRTALLMGFVAMTFLAALLLLARARLALAEARLNRAEQHAASLGLLEDA